jgi:N-acetylglucosaminyl-diphospho-decaprenol L-rhamnosyltransferase
VLGFVACGAVVRRSAFLEADGFHPRFEVGGEESILVLP